jgi:TetR/AcrR family fatty acid metabolism transcriptional regulator
MTPQSHRRHSKSHVVGDFRRSQILEAARHSFARHGLNATTIDQIAKHARVAKGTVYLYYRSKDEILRHTLDAGLSALSAETLPAISTTGTIDERLQRFLRGMLGYYEENRTFLELCQFELDLDLRKRARRHFGRLYTAQARAWQSALAQARKDGEIAAIDARQTALAIVSLGHGLALQRLRGWSDAPIEEHVKHASALVWKGLSPR